MHLTACDNTQPSKKQCQTAQPLVSLKLDQRIHHHQTDLGAGIKHQDALLFSDWRDYKHQRSDRQLSHSLPDQMKFSEKTSAIRKWSYPHAKHAKGSSNLYSTLLKCRACHDICTRPSESAARPWLRAVPATKSALDLEQVLRLPQNLHLSVRKSGACAQSARNSSRVHPNAIRESRNSPSQSAVVSDAHENQNGICTSGCQSAAPATQFKPSENLARLCHWATFRDRGEPVANPWRTRASAFSQAQISWLAQHFRWVECRYRGRRSAFSKLGANRQTDK